MKPMTIAASRTLKFGVGLRILPGPAQPVHAVSGMATARTAASLASSNFAQPDGALRSRRHELDELMRQFVEEPSLAADLGCRFASLTAGGIGLLGGQSSQFPTGRNKLHL